MAGVKYVVELAGRSIEVGLQSLGGQVIAHVNGKSIPIELLRNPGGSLLTMDIANRRAILTLAKNRSGYKIQAAGRELLLTVETASIRELRRHLKAASIGRTGEEVIESHMPGLIVKVQVEPGQAVRKGDGLVVIEAMKMENEIRASNDGIIQKIMVKAGQEVKGGQPLCVIQSQSLE